MIEVACLLRGGKEPDGRFLGFDKEDLIRFGGEDRRAGDEMIYAGVLDQKNKGLERNHRRYLYQFHHLHPHHRSPLGELYISVSSFG